MNIMQPVSRIARSLDAHLALAWLLALPAVTPLIQPTITRSADGLLHLYRLVALDHMLRQGVFFSRWWPDLVYGYGLPLFVFYAPLSYYITEGLHLLGLSPAMALNASFALALLVSATGMYLLVNDVFGPKAGVLAGAAYVYAPYPLYNILLRGSLPIAWAGALFPLALWSFGRLLKNPRYMPLAAVACAATLLAHNISALIFLPLLFFYLALALAFGSGRPAVRPALGRSLAALGLGLALAAFFLVPAVLEREYIQVERVVTPPDFDYRYNFVDPAQLLALPGPANTGLLNPAAPFLLGAVQVVLAAVGLLALLFRPGPDRRGLMVFALLSLAGAIFIMLPVSVGLWQRVPLMAFIQQPHRLLGITAFLLAILAGAAVTVLPNVKAWGLAVVGSGAVLLFLAAVPLLYPGYYQPLPAGLSLVGMMEYERASGAIGTTSFGEYLPVWVQQVPRESPLEEMYRHGKTVERLDPAYLPAGTTVEQASYGFNRADLTIDAAEPYLAVFQQFYFPGWQARIDGRPAALTPFSERGLVGLSVPAGRHRLQLDFRETPVRLAANGVSGLALLVIVALAIAGHSSTPTQTGRAPLPAGFAGRHLALLAVLGLVLITLKLVYLDHYDNPLKRDFTGTQATGAITSHRVNFGHQAQLLGYDLERRAVAPGQSFELTLYWQALQPLSTNYSALVQLVDGEQHLYAGQDNLHPGSVPASRWLPWGFIKDPHRVQVPPGTPPGDYLLAAGLYDPASWARLPVIQGEAGWPDVVAIPVSVLPPPGPPGLAELAITWPVVHDVRPGLRLLGATPERATLRRNDFLRVALFWEALAAPLPNYRVALRLVDAAGTSLLSTEAYPSYGRYPMPRWQARERVRDTHALWLPANLPAGTYRLQVQVLDEAGPPAGSWSNLGQVVLEE